MNPQGKGQQKKKDTASGQTAEWVVLSRELFHRWYSAVLPYLPKAPWTMILSPKDVVVVDDENDDDD